MQKEVTKLNFKLHQYAEKGVKLVKVTASYKCPQGITLTPWRALGGGGGQKNWVYFFRLFNY